MLATAKPPLQAPQQDQHWACVDRLHKSLAYLGGYQTKVLKFIDDES